MSNNKYLSASRIKVLKTCSWLYWCKYELNLPDRSNDGANRGTICHLVFEVLGNKRHRKHFTKIIRKQDVFASIPVMRLIVKWARKLQVADDENIASIKDMILAGLNYDFLGLRIGKPHKVLSEYSFRISKNDEFKRYNVVGFIDQLFLYKKQKRALIRDWKSSKSVFKGKEVTDNVQEWIYSLAVRENFPDFSDIESEFVFLKHMNSGKGVISSTSKVDHTLDAFEYELAYYQQLVENFDIKMACSNFAADQPFPTDNTFSGRLNCGFASQKGELKKDGTIKWHCPYKFAFDYYSVIDPNGDVVANYYEDQFDESLVPDGFFAVKMTYGGCPKFRS